MSWARAPAAIPEDVFTQANGILVAAALGRVPRDSIAASTVRRTENTEPESLGLVS
jgi:hypothetical protein